MNQTLLAADCDDIGYACRAEGVLHTFENAGIIAEQDTRKQQIYVVFETLY